MRFKKTPQLFLSVELKRLQGEREVPFMLRWC